MPWSRAAKPALAIAMGGALLGACTAGRDLSEAEEAQSTLAALMEDGPLTAEVIAGGRSQDAPPRFCSEGGTGGFPFPIPPPLTGGSIGAGGSIDVPPFPGSAGSVATGGTLVGGSPGGELGAGGVMGSAGSPTAGSPGPITGGFEVTGGSLPPTAGAPSITGGFAVTGGAPPPPPPPSGGFQPATGGFGSTGGSIPTGGVIGGMPGAGGLAASGGAVGGSPASGGFIPSGGIIEPPFTGGFPGDPSGPSCERAPIAFYRFDDCSSDRTDLRDSSNQGHTAYRDVEQGCGDGRSGLAPIFDSRQDLVYVPDQPDFVFDEGVTVAAWINPDDTRSTSTILRRRDGNSSAFALVLHRGRYAFIVRAGRRWFASVSAPATRGEWSHVAGTYDGETVRMYLNGEEVDQARAAGTLPEQSGPILMGNDMTGRRFEGRIDDVWINTLAAPADKIMEFTCVRQDPTVSVNPARTPAVAASTPVTFSLSVTNNNSASCPVEQFAAGTNSLPPGFQSPSGTFGALGQVQEIPSGETGVFDIDIASGEESEPGEYTIDFLTLSLSDFRLTPGVATAVYEVASPTGCFVQSSRELMIRDLSVVDDPIRTSTLGPAGDSRSGAWTFQRLMERIAPTPEGAPDMAEAMLSSFLSPQVVNGFSIPARPQMLDLVLDPWPRTANGKLDLAQAPMQLLAIVNRVDLKDLSKGSAGEGRIVFGVNDPSGFPMEFTVIFEYALPAGDDSEARAWAEDFHALQALPFPSEEYNAALQALTDRFTARDVLPGTPSGSALIDVRTNEIALDFEWQFREFRLDPTSGALNPAPLFQTPDASFNFTPELGRFINQNAGTILTERHDVPASFESAPFQAASVFNNIDIWDAPGITDPDARHKFSLNTCNGCHGGETNTFFLHVSPRFPGEESQLSPFLLGTNTSDPITGEARRLSELHRRRLLMESVVCGP